MKLIHPEIARIAVEFALSGVEQPAYAVIVMVTSVDRIAIAPRNGYLHADLWTAIRNDLPLAEQGFHFRDEHVYDGIIEWDEGERRVMLMTGRRPPSEIELLITHILDKLSSP